MTDRLRVLVADDHTIVRQGVVNLLQDGGACVVVAEAGDGQEAVALAHEHHPDVVVMDLTMPRLSGLEATRRLRDELPDTKVLILTVHDEVEFILPMVRAGADGYLVKDSAADELLGAVQALARGQSWFGPQAARVLAEQTRNPGQVVEDPYGELTTREREVFHLVTEGLTTKEVARVLGISVKTAENHRNRVMDKLGVRNTAELVRYAARRGLLS